MKLYIKEQVFSWGDKFYVMDEHGENKYIVEGEVFSLGKKLHVYDMMGREAAFIRQELMTFLPCFTVSAGGGEIARVKKEFSFLFDCPGQKGILLPFPTLHHRGTGLGD